MPRSGTRALKTDRAVARDTRSASTGYRPTDAEAARAAVELFAAAAQTPDAFDAASGGRPGCRFWNTTGAGCVAIELGVRAGVASHSPGTMVGIFVGRHGALCMESHDGWPSED